MRNDIFSALSDCTVLSVCLCIRRSLSVPFLHIFLCALCTSKGSNGKGKGKEEGGEKRTTLHTPVANSWLRQCAVLRLVVVSWLSLDQSHVFCRTSHTAGCLSLASSLTGFTGWLGYAHVRRSAWFSCPRKSADKVVETRHTRSILSSATLYGIS